MKRDAPYIIGVDGGGTSCRAALIIRATGQRFDAQRGSANVSTAFEPALVTIRATLDDLLIQAGLTAEAYGQSAAHLGLAGVMNAAIAERVAQALPFTASSVTDDRPTTIAGALGAGDGAVAAIGTGSFIGRQVGGRINGIGGWGFFIGDQASGAWLLRRCLEEVMLAVDGLATHTGLSRQILAEHGDDPGEIVQFSLAARPSDYAAMAKTVVAAATAGDALGGQLMDEGAGYIRRALKAVGWRSGERLCMTGGLGPAYATHLGEETVAALGTALDGALALATQPAGRGL